MTDLGERLREAFPVLPLPGEMLAKLERLRDAPGRDRAPRRDRAVAQEQNEQGRRR